MEKVKRLGASFACIGLLGEAGKCLGGHMEDALRRGHAHFEAEAYKQARELAEKEDA
jgi:hypothetical protein